VSRPADRCENGCGKPARGTFRLVEKRGGGLPPFRACSMACAEAWCRFVLGRDRFPPGTRVERLDASAERLDTGGAE
jgi:hypothetical protein